MRCPWQGGMNSPQFSEIDLNNDGLMDLFAFDRVGDKVMTYLKVAGKGDTSYLYSPQYESLFPADLNNWALIRDYNHDGVPDIFTHENTGTRVFKGSRIGGELHFDLVNPLLLYNDGSYNVNIWTNIDDLPEFVDVNNDGDLDVLTYGIFGASIEYYENQTMEHQGDPHYDFDSLKYVEVTMCWGLVAQNSLNNSIVLNVSCKGNGGNGDAPPDGERHAGNTVFAFDADNDGDVDVLNGNIGYDNLAFLHNCGDSSFAYVCEWDSLYPTCSTPMVVPTYPAAFRADLNGDNKMDLLVAPNARTGSRDINNVLAFYNSDDTACQFHYQGDTFLVRHILDFGTDSKATFFDWNGDGLQDIVVGNYGYFRPFMPYMSTLGIYLNVGNATQPMYQLLTTNYNGFDTFNIKALHPAFGDLDGDGLQDLVLGEEFGNMEFLKNNGGQVASFSSTITSPQYFGLDVGQYSAPFIYDIDGDSLNDLVVGRKDGKLTYFHNFGTKTNAQFSPDSANINFGGINVTVPGYTEGYSVPYITRDSAHNMILYVGSNRGAIFKYLVDTANLNGAFTMLDSDLIRQDAGTKATISIADINSDGRPEYLIGNSRGGLMLYSDSLWDTSTLPLTLTDLPLKQGNLLVYPNPAQSYFVCSLTEGTFTNPVLEVFNILGERMIQQTPGPLSAITVNTSSLSSGVYFIRIRDGARTFPAKVIVR